MIDALGNTLEIGDTIMYAVRTKKRISLFMGVVQFIDVKLKWTGDTLDRILVEKDKRYKGQQPSAWITDPIFVILNKYTMEPPERNSKAGRPKLLKNRVPIEGDSS